MKTRMTANAAAASTAATHRAASATGPASGGNALPTKVRRIGVSVAILQTRALALCELARQHQTGLAACGWTPQRTAGVEAAREALDRAIEAAQVERNTQRERAVQLQQRTLAARVLRDQLAAALRLVAKRDPASVDLAQLQKGTSSESARRLTIWLRGARSAVAKHEAELAPLFHESPTRLLQRHLTTLSRLQGSQDAGRRMLRLGTLRIADAKLRLSSAIDDLHLAATVAFAGSPELLRLFRKGFEPRRHAAASADAAAYGLTDTLTAGAQALCSSV
jgi:hypothetical protein